MNSTPEQMAHRLSRWLAENGLAVVTTGAGERWEIAYSFPEIDDCVFPPMVIEGQSLKIPKGSPQIIADVLLQASIALH